MPVFLGTPDPQYRRFFDLLDVGVFDYDNGGLEARAGSLAMVGDFFPKNGGRTGLSMW